MSARNGKALAAPLRANGPNLSPADRLRKRLLTPLEAAMYLGFRSVWPIRTLMWRGELPYVRTGKRRIAFDVQDLDRFIEERKTCERIH